MKKYLLKEKRLLFVTLLFSLMSSLSFVFVAVLLQKVLDIVIVGDMQKFKQILLSSIVYIIVLGTVTYLQSFFSKMVICRITANIRLNVFNGIMSQSIESFNSVDTGDYISVINNDIKIIEDHYLVPLFEIIQYITIFIGSLGVMIYFNLIITICVLIAIICMIVIPSLFGTILEKRQGEYSHQLAIFTNKLKDILLGFEVIKSYHMKKQIYQQFRDTNRELYKSKYDVDKTMALSEGLSITLSLCVQVFVVLLSAYYVLVGKTTVGVLIGMVQATSNLANPILVVFSNLPKIKGVSPIINRINTYEEKCTKQGNSITLNDQIEIKGLTFCYEENVPILNNINFQFKRGKKYVIVGKSGCGKTTFAKLLSGYYSKYIGDIFYDNKNILETNFDEISTLSSFIHQNVYMFNDTIKDNICLYEDYPLNKISTVLKESGLLEVIAQKDKGISYQVGENGNLLSGGQKQRVAVARAIIRSKPLLILDEGTSAIDMQTAYDIENCLLKIDDLTLITITHNLKEELLSKYDEIIYMENGKIIENGSYYDLLKTKGDFYNYITLK